MRARITTLVMVAWFVASGVAFGQGSNALAGAWERVSLLNAEGQPAQPPAPPAYVIFTGNGQFIQVAVPPGRSKVDKPLQEMTKEELLARFQGVTARRGTYTIKGTVVTRTSSVHTDPNQEGTDQVSAFRIEGDTLILSSTDPKIKAEARFRRVK